MGTLETLSQAFKDLPVALAVLNREGQFLFRNAAFQKVFPAVEHVEDLPDPAAPPPILKALKSGSFFERQCPLGHLTISPINDLFVLRAEEAPELFEGFKQFAESVPELLFVLDEHDVCIWVNKEAASHIIMKNVEDFTPPHMLEQVKSWIARVRETGETMTGEPLWHEGEGGRFCYGTRWVPVEEGGRVRFVCIVAIDMTDQVLNDEKLQASEERYRNLLHNSLDVICVFTTELTLQYVTPNVSEYLGFEPEELIGRNLLEFAEPNDIRDIFAKLNALELSPTIPQTNETRIRRKDGSFTTMEARIRRVDSLGEPVVFVNARDISARRELEGMRQNLLRADKLASIGQLAAGVAHEINNPAAFISTNLYVLKEYTQRFNEMHQSLVSFALGLPEDAREYYLNFLEENEIPHLLDDMLKIVDTNMEGMDRISLIVRDLLTFSKEGGEDMEVFNVNSVVETACTIVRNQISLTGKLALVMEDLPPILGHPGKLTQVMVNLLVNAAHAITSSAGDQVVRVTTRSTSEGVVVEVSDTGPGIPPEVQAKIYEPFYTTKSPEHGTGLGLWLCKEIIKQARGEIGFETSSSGTTFRILLQHMPSGGHATSEAESISGHRVLIIGRSSMTARCQTIARKHGCATVDNVDQALLLLEVDQDFDLIFCPGSFQSHRGLVWDALKESWPDLLSRLVVLSENELDVPPEVRRARPPEELGALIEEFLEAS